MGEAVSSGVLARRGGAVAFGILLAAATLAVVGFSAAPIELGRGNVAVGIAVVAVVLLGVDALHRHYGPGLPWRPLLVRALGASVFLLPLFVHADAAPLPPRQRTADQEPLQELRPGGNSEFATTVDRAYLGLLILLAIGLLLWSGILGLLVRRIRLLVSRREAVTPGSAGDPVGSLDDVHPASASQALRRSADALRASDDARRAVITAYVALERHLEEVTQRRRAETAHEFVTRALEREPRFDSERVDALLEIFGAARFSALPVSQDDAARARGHLRALVGR